MEIILIDDGSTDNSLQICKEYARRDNRIVVLHHDNHGVSYTRNRGLDIATGEYIMFVDADDTVSYEWVNSYVDAINSTNSDMVIGGLTIISDDSKTEETYPPVIGVIGKEIWKYICETESGIFGYVPNKLYKRVIISDIRFNENMTVQEDFAFALDVYANAKRIALIDETGYYYKYAINKRSTPFLDLIGNQIKLLSYTGEIMNDHKVSFEKPVDLIVGWTYQFLFESSIDEEFINKCKAVREIQDTKFISTLNPRVNEKYAIYRLLNNKRYKTIKNWFSIRSFAKRCLFFR